MQENGETVVALRAKTEGTRWFRFTVDRSSRENTSGLFLQAGNSIGFHSSEYSVAVCKNILKRYLNPFYHRTCLSTFLIALHFPLEAERRESEVFGE